MFDLHTLNENEKATNRAGRLSDRQTSVIRGRIADGRRVFIAAAVLTPLAFFGIFLLPRSSQFGDLLTVFGYMLVFGPGLLIVSGLYTLQNRRVLYGAQVKKVSGLIEKRKRKLKTKGGFDLYAYELLVSGEYIHIDHKRFNEIEEGPGTVYFVSERNSASQYLFSEPVSQAHRPG